MSRLSDIGLLVPAFRERLEEALKVTRGQGYKPLLWETLRSPGRAKELAAKGVGIVASMHTLGLAADVICLDHRWGCHEHHCSFFEAFGVNAEKLGLTWGGRWKRVDKPHVQLPPIRLQDKVRACDPEHLDTLCRAILAGEVR